MLPNSIYDYIRKIGNHAYEKYVRYLHSQSAHTNIISYFIVLDMNHGILYSFHVCDAMLIAIACSNNNISRIFGVQTHPISGAYHQHKNQSYNIQNTSIGKLLCGHILSIRIQYFK